MVKKHFPHWCFFSFLLVLLLSNRPLPIFAQENTSDIDTLLTELSLLQAFELLEQRYPALQDAALLTAIHQKKIERIDLTALPTLHLKAEGRLQSENVKLDVGDLPIPLDIDLPLYSLRTYAEAQYSILDGGILEAQKGIEVVKLEAQKQEIEVTRFSLRDRLVALFVNREVLKTQITVFDLALADLGIRKSNVQASVEEGVLLESELTKLAVKELEFNAHKANLLAKIKGLEVALSDLLGIRLGNDAVLTLPSLESVSTVPNIQRPEQQLFTLKSQALLAQSALIDASLKPKLGAFAQVGVGYPNPLNFFDTNISPYGVIGLKFNWQITDWDKHKLDKEILSLEAKKIQHTAETFDFNLQSQDAAYLAAVNRLQEQIDYDKKIAALQASLLTQLGIQLDEGVITSSDYLTQVNAELSAKQNFLIHQAELLKLQLEFWNQRGAF